MKNIKKLFNKKLFRSILGLLAIASLFVLVEYQKEKRELTQTTKMFALLPEDIDQVMLAKPAQQLGNKLSQTYMSQFPQELQEVFSQIDTLLMSQKILATSGVENIFVVKPIKGFDTQRMVKIVSENQGTVYAYKMVDDLYIYFPLGQDFGPNAQSNFAKAWLQDDAIQQLAHNDFSLLMRQAPALASSAQLGNTKYLIASFKLSPKQTNMVVSAWFEQQQNISSPKFSPKFDKQLTQNNLAYLELGSLASFMNLSENDLKIFLQQRIASTQIQLTTDQTEVLMNTLKGNIGIALQPSMYSLGIGISLMFENPELYTLLKPFVPMMISYMGSQGTLSGTQTKLLEDENMVGAQLTLPTGEPFVIRVIKENKGTTISLGEPIIEGKKINISQKNKHAFLQFSINPSSIIQHLQKLEMIGLDSSSSKAWLSLLSGDVLQGYLVRDANKISLIAEQKK